MKTWNQVRELVNAAEENHWDLATFKAVLDWEWDGKLTGGVRGLRPGKKRTMSPEARKRISDAQKARWKKAKKSSGE
jgi:hypothetical protein